MLTLVVKEFGEDHHPPGLHEKPLQPGLQPEEEEEGTSFFTCADSEQSEMPVNTRTADPRRETISV